MILAIMIPEHMFEGKIPIIIVFVKTIEYFEYVWLINKD